MMRSILINPFSRTVSEYNYEVGLKSLYDALECNFVDAVAVGNNLVMYIDDAGMLNPFSSQAFFSIDANIPMSGKALIVAIDKEGCDVEVDASLINIVKSRIKWIDNETVATMAKNGRFVTKFIQVSDEGVILESSIPFEFKDY